MQFDTLLIQEEDAPVATRYDVSDWGKRKQVFPVHLVMSDQIRNQKKKFPFDESPDTICNKFPKLELLLASMLREELLKSFCSAPLAGVYLQKSLQNYSFFSRFCKALARCRLIHGESSGLGPLYSKWLPFLKRLQKWVQKKF